MQQYKNLLRDILTNGRRRGDRTGTGTLSVFGRQLTFNLQEGFPLVTLKRTPWRAVVAELIWFLEGSTCNNRLRLLSSVNKDQRGIWDQWVLTEEFAQANPVTIDGVNAIDTRRIGSLGPIYGGQWRNWCGVADLSDGQVGRERVDQIRGLVNSLKHNPYSRRHIVSAWSVTDLPDESKSPQQNVLEGRMSLAPCHPFWQCYVRDMTLEERLEYYNTHLASIGMRLGIDASTDHAATHELLDKLGVCSRYLDLHLYQRSWDVPVGAPFNIASYALLTHLLAMECGYLPGELIISTGDAHIYSNQMAEVDIMMMRDIRPMPKFRLDALVNLSDIMNPYIEDKSEIIQRICDGIEGYDPHPAIKIAVAT